MRQVFKLTITLTPRGEANAFATYFLTDIEPNPRAIQNFVAMQGHTCTVDVEPLALFSTNGVEVIAQWLAEVMPPAQPSADGRDEFPETVGDPRDARVNELDRAVRGIERKFDQLLTMLGNRNEPPALTPTIGHPTIGHAIASEHNTGAADWHDSVQPVSRQTRAGGNDPRRSARRGATPEFNADPEHKSNSMATLGTPASPYQPGKGATGASRGTFILTVGADANGNPIAIEEPPPIVGDTLTRGTR